MGDGDADMHMRTEATRSFVRKLQDLADDYAVWPQRKATLDALDTAIGQRDRIAAAFDGHYRDATAAVFAIADQVARTAPQAASAGSFAIGEYEQAEHYATLAVDIGR